MSKIYEFFLNIWKSTLASDLHWIIKAFLAMLLLCIMAFPFQIVVVVVIGIVENGWVSIILAITVLLLLAWIFFLQNNNIKSDRFNTRFQSEHQNNSHYSSSQGNYNDYDKELYERKLREEYERKFTDFKADFERRYRDEIDRLAREKAKEFINNEMPFD